MKKLNQAGGRNFGYGKQMHFAAKQALLDKYGAQNKFATQAAHYNRFKHFSSWCKELGVRDAREVSPELVVRYANDVSKKVATQELSVSYAQNLISSVNTVLSALRGDNALTISPAKAVGKRTHIRQSAPLSYDRSRFNLALQQLSSQEAKMALCFAREFGLRLREVGLFRPKEALQQYQRTGRIDIQRGVKGGRSVLREIPITNRQVALLERAVEVLGKYKCLVDKHGKFTDWKNALYHEYRASGAQVLLGKFHDNRAAFACEKMRQLTGKDARAVNPQTTLNKSEEREASLLIAAMLGHGRAEVVRSYTG